MRDALRWPRRPVAAICSDGRPQDFKIWPPTGSGPAAEARDIGQFCFRGPRTGRQHFPFRRSVGGARLSSGRGRDPSCNTRDTCLSGARPQDPGLTPIWQRFGCRGSRTSARRLILLSKLARSPRCHLLRPLPPKRLKNLKMPFSTPGLPLSQGRSPTICLGMSSTCRRDDASTYHPSTE